jgi:hypothetical protein
MAYRISKEALVPLLAKCIIRHGTLKNVSEYPAKVSESGGDATVTEEFIALREIRRYEDSDEMIRSAYEKALVACQSAIEQAEEEISDLKNRLPNKPDNIKRSFLEIPNLRYIILWFGVVAIAAWMDEENFSATLAAAVVIAGTGFLCFLAVINRGGGLTNYDPKQTRGVNDGK